MVSIVFIRYETDYRKLSKIDEQNVVSFTGCMWLTLYYLIFIWPPNKSYYRLNEWLVKQCADIILKWTYSIFRIFLDECEFDTHIFHSTIYHFNESSNVYLKK